MAAHQQPEGGGLPRRVVFVRVQPQHGDRGLAGQPVIVGSQLRDQPSRRVRYPVLGELMDVETDSGRQTEGMGVDELGELVDGRVSGHPRRMTHVIRAA